MKPVWLGIALFFLCLLAGSWWWYSHSLSPVGSSADPQTFVIETGQAASVVVRHLKQSALIRSYLAGRIYHHFHRQVFKPGIYYLTGTKSLPAIFTDLSQGPKDIKITFPEGWRREQYAARLKSVFSDFDTSRFLKLTASLEGQLFPDTYYFPVDPAPEKAVSIMTANFAKKSGLLSSQSDLLTIASLVERESNNPQDSGLIAGIIIKRLKNGWPLQIDATIQYAKDTLDCQDRVLTCDYWQPIYNTQLVSPYNTYLYQGLPPSPISNPGLVSIQAVLNPVTSEYWYYLTGNNGITYFSKTLSEHQSHIDTRLKL